MPWAASSIRRDLIAKAVRQGLAPGNGLEPLHFQYAKKLEKPLVVGLLGTGQQGMRLLAAVNPTFITVKAIADLRPSNRQSCGRELRQRLGTAVIESYESDCWQRPRPTGWRR